MNKKETVSEEIISYMEEKYSDKFTYSAPFGGGAGAKTKQVLLKSEKYPEYDIWVEYSFETEKYRDNYVDYKYKKKVEDYMSEQISNKLDCKVKFKRNISTRGCYADYTDDTTLEEYINSEEQKISFSAVALNCTLEKEEMEEILSDMLKDIKADLFGTISFVDKEDEFSDFFQKDYSEQYSYPCVDINESDVGFITFDWR